MGAFDAVDRRFAGFIEDLVSHQVLVEEDDQRRLVAAMSPALREAGLELREVGLDGGYPVFGLLSTGATPSRPKNLIFGSTRKPDLRVSSTIDNEIEIIDPRGNLVYDEPIGLAGLRWQDLQDWWQTRNPGLGADAAKDALYKRLRACLPEQSPPQLLLFDLYHRIHGRDIPCLPALLPGVWLHWDHKTVQERGVQALLGQRMDFLLLTPNHGRIVLEVDGASHYTDDDNRPSPSRYARNARLGRDLQLRGYAAYRFGALELRDASQAAPLLTDFFTELFAKHGVAC